MILNPLAVGGVNQATRPYFSYPDFADQRARLPPQGDQRPGLCQAIVDVAAGKFIHDPSVTTHLLILVRSDSNPPTEHDKLSTLSAQERRVLALVAEGKTNKEIAEQMGLSVKNYLSNIFEKLKISRRSQAAVHFYTSNRGPK